MFLKTASALKGGARKGIAGVWKEGIGNQGKEDKEGKEKEEQEKVCEIGRSSSNG